MKKVFALWGLNVIINQTAVKGTLPHGNLGIKDSLNKRAGIGPVDYSFNFCVPLMNL
jgi:hypothetical protein